MESLLGFFLIFSASCYAACNTTLTLEFLPNSNHTVTCADGSDAGFYYGLPTTPSSKYIIWLGEGDICGTNETCVDKFLSKRLDDPTLCDPDFENDINVNLFPDTIEGRGKCYAARLQHTSVWYSPNYTTITGETILCGDDPHFKDYNRIYLPACTLDWFLGDGTDLPNSTLPLWRGARVVNALMTRLTKPPFNIAAASRVVIGGTGGGGVGAINHFRRLRTGPLNTVFNVLALVDSAYLVNSERFANLSRVYMGEDQSSFKIEQILRDGFASWVGSAFTDAECKSFWGPGESYRCGFANQVLSQPSLQLERVMVIQSQYDLLNLANLDLFNQSLFNLFADNASYAQNAVNYIESFGSRARADLETTGYIRGAADNVYFFSPSCGQYGYIVPTEQQRVEPDLADMGVAGKLLFRRDDFVWNNVAIHDLSLREAIVQWLQAEGTERPKNLTSSLDQSDRNGIRSDRCQTFLCNPTCSNVVVPFQVQSLWGSCSQRLVIAYCLIMLGTWWFIFLVALSAVCLFRRRTKLYWDNVIHEEHEQYTKDPEAEQKSRQIAEDELVRDAFASARRVHLMVRNLSYWAPPRKSGRAFQILRSVSAGFAAGSVHALMGPSGSGKSTLLDIVALTRDSGIMTGSHYVNGVDSFSKKAAFLRVWLSHNVSYVKQQDNMFPYITVREHLTHAAWLMLPEYMETEQKLRRVWQVIKLMGLEKAADTICGDGGVEVEGGISGGQRRRVSVATQLLRLPACLVLDEPTSGLDATNALSLVKSLHTLAHRGGTNVIMTIHQPRREIFRFLDTLKILVGGRILFAGMPKEAFDHFEVSRKLNIGDEVLDQLGKAQLDSVLAYQRKYENGPLGKKVEQELAQELVLDFDATLAAQLEYTLTTNALADGRWSWTESSSAPLLMYVLLSRTIKRGGFDVSKTILISLVGGCLVGIVFISATDSYRRHISLAYLSVATMTFLQGTFIGDRYWAEKFMYTFESEAGTARPWISFLASMYARIVVSSTMEALAFAIPVFFIARQRNDENQVLFFLLVLVMTAVCTATQYLMVEIYFMRPDDKRTGALVNIALLSMSALFNGFIIQLSDLPIFLRWVPYIMLSYWAFVALLLNDIAGFILPCNASELECSARTGDAIIKTLNYDDRDIFQSLFALLVMTGSFMFFGILFFFFKWVSPLGRGIKRRTSKELKQDEADFRARAKELAAQSENTSTMQGVLNDGAKLQKQGSGKGLARHNSSDGSHRADSLGRNDSLGRGDSIGSDSDRNLMVLKPRPQTGFEDAAKTLQFSPPTEQDPDQFNVFLDQAEQEVSAHPEVPRLCCRNDQLIMIPFLSRIGLVLYFIIDFLASATICIGQDANSDILNIGSVVTEVTEILGSFGSFDVETINVVFVGVTGGFLIGYILQFVIQLLFLFPRDVDGRLNPCTRVAVLDILGLALIGLDIILLFVLLGAGKGAALQIYLLVAIRIVRILRVSTFWYKISAFHELRVIAYLEYKLVLLEEYDPTQYGANEGNDIGDNEKDKKPPVPSRATKPYVDPALLAPPEKKTQPKDEGFFRRTIRRVSESQGQKRVSLQRRISDANKRISSQHPGQSAKSSATGSSSQNPPPVAPRPSNNKSTTQNPPPAPRSRAPMVPASLTAGFGRISMKLGSEAPLVPPRPPTLPSFVRGPPPGLSAGSRLPTLPSGPPPVISSRTEQRIAGFGITPGAMQLINVQRGNNTQTRGKARRDEPSMDEI